MLKLEMHSNNLTVDFSCSDASGDHVHLLDMLNSLIQELHNHENVNLTIRTNENEYPVRT